MLLPLMAQNNTNSSYTRFGYGDLGERSFGAGRAMGGGLGDVYKRQGMVIWENVRSAQVEPWAVSVTDYVRRNK